MAKLTGYPHPITEITERALGVVYVYCTYYNRRVINSI